MGDIRVSAKTVEEAITNACLELGVTSDQLEYNVIEKGSAGFLGIGMKQAVIEAHKKYVKPEVKETPKHETPKYEIPKQEVPKRQVWKQEQSKSEEFKSGTQKKESFYKNSSKKNMPKYDSAKKVNTRAEDSKREEKKPEFVHRDVELTEVSDKAKQEVVLFLEQTLKAMDMEVTITTGIDSEGALEVDMAGNNMGILIGKRGQTLDSLQYLANRVANKYQDGYVRVKLDTENYRARRKATLENLAKNIAYKVKKNKKPISLEPMNPYERRIIHAALQSDRYVTTHSEGDEPYRKVVVTLKK